MPVSRDDVVNTRTRETGYVTSWASIGRRRRFLYGPDLGAEQRSSGCPSPFRDSCPEHWTQKSLVLVGPRSFLSWNRGGIGEFAWGGASVPTDPEDIAERVVSYLKGSSQTLRRYPDRNARQGSAYQRSSRSPARS